MAAGLCEKRRQTIEKRQALAPSKEHDDLVRFALSGLSCMCAATGKFIVNVKELKLRLKLNWYSLTENVLHMLWE